MLLPTDVFVPEVRAKGTQQNEKQELLQPFEFIHILFKTFCRFVAV